MSKRIEFVWPDQLVDAIDGQLDGRPRSVWMRRLAEAELARLGRTEPLATGDVLVNARTDTSFVVEEPDPSVEVPAVPAPTFEKPSPVNESVEEWRTRTHGRPKPLLAANGCPECGGLGRMHQRGCKNGR